MREPPTVRINHRLRQERIRRNWHQQNVADELGTTVVTVNRWERGIQQPSAYFRLKLCALFGKSAEELGLLPETLPSETSVEVEAQALVDGSSSLADDSSDPLLRHETLPPSIPQTAQSTGSPTQPYQNRARMLSRLRRTYHDLMSQSLAGVAQIELGLGNKPGAVQNTVSLLFRTSTYPEHLLPPGTSIIHVYDEAARELLILGAPGAGKSTLLVELAKELVERAHADETHPLPVILPLSSWAVKRTPLQRWLAERVAEFYHIPQALAQRWIDEDQLLPLLDGLDEMEETARPACIEAINRYQSDHLRVPLVVCSRQSEYEEASTRQRLRLQNAVVVQALPHEQVQRYLAQVSQSLIPLNHILTTNTTLASLVTTPLMVHVLILTYRGRSLYHLSTKPEELQKQIWADYLARMVEHKGEYPLHVTGVWLGWLARQMRKHNQTIFYLEHIQPDWLTEGARCFYNWLGVRLPAMIIGVLVTILVGSFFLDVLNWRNLSQVVAFGVVMGELLCPTGSEESAHSAPKRRRRWGTALARSIGAGLVVGFSEGWGVDSTFGAWLSDGIAYGVVFGLASLFFQWVFSVSSSRASSRPHSHAGRWDTLLSVIRHHHFQRALLVALLIGLANGLIVALTYDLRTGLSAGLGYGLSVGLSYGLSVGLISVILEHLQQAVHPTERISLSWRNLRNRLFAPTHLRLTLVLTGCIIVFVELSVNLTVQLSYGLSPGLSYGPGVGLNYGLSIGLVYWLLLGLYQSIAQERIEDQDRRVLNQGIRQSHQNALLFGLISGTLLGGMGLVIFSLSNGLKIFGAFFVLGSLFFWVIMGGLAVWRHYLIRFLLQRMQTFPWNASRFLDDAATRILLQRVGGGYRFSHRLLLDYLADNTQ